MSNIKSDLMHLPHFSGISEQTKSKILAVVDFEVAASDYSIDELTTGLRFLLASHSAYYSDYIQPQTASETHQPDRFFGVPNSVDWQRSSLPASTKKVNILRIQIILSVLLFLIVGIPSYIFLDPLELFELDIEDLTDGQHIALRAASATIIGSALVCLNTLFFKKIKCNSSVEPHTLPPNSELIQLLQPAKRLIDTIWAQPTDDREQVIAFVKTVIRLHLEKLAKVALVDERSRLIQETIAPPFAYDHYLQPLEVAPIRQVNSVKV